MTILKSQAKLHTSSSLTMSSHLCWLPTIGMVCYTRGPGRLRLSEFVQISELFSIYITDICQTSESFAKSVNLKKERAERTIPSVEATGILR